MTDEWLSGPQLVDLEFDPYEEYEQSFNEAFEFGTKVQTAQFELHKNLYRYNAMLDQASHREVYLDDQLMSVIYRRLENVQEDIKNIMKTISELKDEMVKVRKRAGIVPRNEQQAEEMRTNKEWLTANSTFKFLQRLNVIDSCWKISELYEKVVSNQITIEDAILELS